MQALARIERVRGRNRRGAPRRTLSLGASLVETGDEAVIHDLSATGILIETDAELATSDQLLLDLPEVGSTVATVLWNSGRYFGCEFQQPISKAAISAALLRNPIAQKLVGYDEAETDDQDRPEPIDDRYSLGVRLRVILGASVILWATILWATGLL